jgi:hypothetical protein
MAAATDIALDSLCWEICPDFGNDCRPAGISRADIYLNGAVWGKYWACWPPAGGDGVKLLLSLYNPVLQRPDAAILFQCAAGSGICLPLEAAESLWPGDSWGNCPIPAAEVAQYEKYRFAQQLARHLTILDPALARSLKRLPGLYIDLENLSEYRKSEGCHYVWQERWQRLLSAFEAA